MTWISSGIFWVCVHLRLLVFMAWIASGIFWVCVHFRLVVFLWHELLPVYFEYMHTWDWWSFYGMNCFWYILSVCTLETVGLFMAWIASGIYWVCAHLRLMSMDRPNCSLSDMETVKQCLTAFPNIGALCSLCSISWGAITCDLFPFKTYWS